VPHIIKTTISQDRVIQCVNAALDRKAKDLVILKVKEISSFTDFFIICSGTSDRQVKAIADHVAKKLKTAGILPLGIEGETGGNWILMDYGDVVIHIFYEPTREFYDIERLWSDVPTMAIGDDVTEISALTDEMHHPE
jgi:ribosome-associated protein